MKLSWNTTDYAIGQLGLVELASSYLNDRAHRMWSKAELVEHINAAQLNLAAAINRIHREFFTTSATTPVVALQSYYSLPNDLVKLYGLEVVNSATTDREPRELITVAMSDRRFYEGLAQANSKDEYKFFFVAGTLVKLLPEAGSTVAGEQIRVHYVKRLSRQEADDDVSEIPEQHHTLLAMDAARLAFIKTKQQNAQLEQMRAEYYQAMTQELTTFNVTAENRVEPWWGSFGPLDKAVEQIIN